MNVQRVYSSAQLFDAMLASRPAMFCANVAGVEKICDTFRAAANVYYERRVHPGFSLPLRYHRRRIERLVDRFALDEPSFPEQVGVATQAFLEAPTELERLQNVLETLDQFREKRVAHYSSQRESGEQLMLDALEQPRDTPAYANARDLRENVLSRAVLSYMVFKKRFPNMGDLPISMLALNGGELVLQMMSYGVIAHPERFAWTIPFSLIFSPMANALIRMVGRVTTNSSRVDPRGEKLAAAAESHTLTAAKRAIFFRNLGQFLLIGDVIPRTFSVPLEGARLLAGTGSLRAFGDATGNFLEGAVMLVPRALRRLFRPRERLANLQTMTIAGREIIHQRRGELKRAWEFYKIGFWLDAIQIVAFATTAVVATGASYDITKLVAQYFKSLAFNAGLMAADYPAQNYLPIQLRTPAALLFRSSSLVFMGWLTMPK